LERLALRRFLSTSEATSFLLILCTRLSLLKFSAIPLERSFRPSYFIVVRFSSLKPPLKLATALGPPSFSTRSMLTPPFHGSLLSLNPPSPFLYQWRPFFAPFCKISFTPYVLSPPALPKSFPTSDTLHSCLSLPPAPILAMCILFFFSFYAVLYLSDALSFVYI